MEGKPKAYIGYTDGYLWNGWATPYFTLAEAKKIQADWDGLTYDENADEFRIQYEEYDEPYIWKGEDIYTVDGKLHLYGIGAYSHVWDKLYDHEKQYLAAQIIEFVADYDPYEYHDSYDNEDECFEAVLSELLDLEVFAKCYEIMYDTKLGREETYNKLSEVLHI